MKQMFMAGQNPNDFVQPTPEIDEKKSAKENSSDPLISQPTPSKRLNIKAKMVNVVEHIVEIIIAHGFYEAGKTLIVDIIPPLAVIGLSFINYSSASLTQGL
jgi:hypothetical protein